MTSTAPSLISDARLARTVGWYFSRGRPDWGYDEAQWRQITRVLLDILETTARRDGSTIAYSELVRGTDVATHEAWWHVVSDLLEVLVKACVDADLPIITALVTYKDVPHPGRGFFDAAKRFGRQPRGQADDTYWIEELHRVHARWSS